MIQMNTIVWGFNDFRKYLVGILASEKSRTELSSYEVLLL